jgi:predicted Ser/Thr protein kinase
MIPIDVHKDLLRKYLPEYTIDGERPIGTGTWAVVYKGYSKTVPVAIKVHECHIYQVP